MYYIHLFRCYWWLKLKSWASQRLHIFASSSPATKCVRTWKPSHAHKAAPWQLLLQTAHCRPTSHWRSHSSVLHSQSRTVFLVSHWELPSYLSLLPPIVQSDVWCLRVNCSIDVSDFWDCFIICFMFKLTLGAIGITSSSCLQTWVISKTIKWSV